MFSSFVSFVADNAMPILSTVAGMSVGGYSEYLWGHVEGCDNSSRVLTTAFLAIGIVGVAFSAMNRKFRKDIYKIHPEYSKTSLGYKIQSTLYILGTYSAGISLGSGVTAITEEGLKKCYDTNTYGIVILGAGSLFIVLNGFDRCRLHRKTSHMNRVAPLLLATAPPMPFTGADVEGVELTFARRRPEDDIPDWI